MLSRYFAHLGNSWRHHLGLQLATILVLTAGFTVVAGVVNMSENLYRILTLWGDSMQMSVYFAENATDDNLSTVRKYIEDSGKFEAPKFVSKPEALRAFKDQIASYAPDLLNDAEVEKFIPSSFQLGVKKNVPVADHLGVLQQTAGALKSFAGVDDISFGQEWVKNYSTLMQAIHFGGAIFIGVLLLSALFVMSNSVHTSISQRRSEIEVLELIGATTRYIRAPFIFEGAALGFISTAVGLALTFGLYTAAKQVLSAQLSLLQVGQHLHYLSPVSLISLFAIGPLMGAFSAWICVRRINTGWAASRAKGAE